MWAGVHVRELVCLGLRGGTFVAGTSGSVRACASTRVASCQPTALQVCVPAPMSEGRVFSPPCLEQPCGLARVCVCSPGARVPCVPARVPGAGSVPPRAPAPLSFPSLRRAGRVVPLRHRGRAVPHAGADPAPAQVSGAAPLPPQSAPVPVTAAAPSPQGPPGRHLQGADGDRAPADQACRAPGPGGALPRHQRACPLVTAPVPSL